MTLALLNLAPADLNMTPADVNMAPENLNMTPALLNLAPAVLNTDAADLNMAPAVVNMVTADINMATADVNMATADVNMATAVLNMTPALLNMAPAGGTEQGTGSAGNIPKMDGRIKKGKKQSRTRANKRANTGALRLAPTSRSFAFFAANKTPFGEPLCLRALVAIFWAAERADEFCINASPGHLIQKPGWD